MLSIRGGPKVVLYIAKSFYFIIEGKNYIAKSKNIAMQTKDLATKMEPKNAIYIVKY